ncbi:MAG: trehalose-6-phosphate synthase, partial [Methanobacteriaceae archaeon]|nr:trehalose-6-phosphate synthase [Methanobacteriaceae archaeon]
MVNDPRSRIESFLADKNLIIASNRGPVEFQKDEKGKITMKRGAGGLVSTLLPLMETVNGTWVASAMSLVDAEVAGKYPENRVPITEDDFKFWVPFVVVDKERYEYFYSVISNPLLWFVQHYMWNTPYTPEIDENIHKAWKTGYEYVNKLFSRKIIEEANRNEKKPLIIIQDYHLYLCPSFIRKELGDIFLSQFIHIPWPQPDYFSLIPQYMEEAIIKGILSNNIVGFHIAKYATNFMMTCEKYAERVDYDRGVVYFEGREVYIKNYPISVDDVGIKEFSESDEVKKKEKLVKEIKGDNLLIYRTDRSDLSKNIIRGFKAYDLFLDKYPEFRGKVKFLTTGKPTRQQIKEYRDYHAEIMKLIGQINSKHLKNQWKPIEYIFKADYALVSAAFKNYDCLLVNPIADGMNIVPKEASVINKNNGVLILSEKAGCYEELGEYSLNVNPFDVSQTADAIY